MSIAFCGAGGTGKGALMEEVMKYVLSLHPLPSRFQTIARKICPGAKSYQDMSIEDHILVQYSTVTAQMAQEQLCYQKGWDFLAERSVLDFLPYMYGALRKAYGTDTARISLIYDRYQNYVLDYLRNHPYPILVYFPVEFIPKDDNPWKERNPENQKKTDQFLQHILSDEIMKNPQKYKIKYLITAHGSVKERSKAVIKAYNEEKNSFK